MKAERLLQISLVTLISLGALLLGMSQQNLWLPALAVFACITSFYFTDVLGWFRLHPQLANVVAVAAVAIAMVDLYRQDYSTRILAIANLLIYLQCVLLYQKKHVRRYWQLTVLSFLQVVVASALNLGMEYGFFLALYSLVAISTLTLLFVYCASLPFVSARADDAAAGDALSAEFGSEGPGPMTTRTTLESTRSSDDPSAPMLNSGLAGQVVLTTAATIVCAITIFFMLPRFRDSSWTSEGEVRLTGFSTEVSLNDMGELLESPEEVMHAWFEDATGSPYLIQGDPYFRGAVLANYSRGRWRQSHTPNYVRRFTADTQARSQGDVVRQRIKLQPQQNKTLFAVAPAYQLALTRPTEFGIRQAPSTCELTLIETGPDEVRIIDYTLGTSGLRGSRQIPFLPVLPGREPDARCLSVDGETWKPIADNILQTAGTSAAQEYTAARVLERHFLTGEYTYSLTVRHRTRAREDPVLRFVTDDKRGHCEYFASALTLMLRSQSIPSRLVVGYKGAEYNSVGRYYLVRELHAHAWVEAFFRADQLPTTVRPPADSGVVGYWLRLDPTPADDDGLLAEGVTWLERLADYRDYLQLLWNDYVLGLDSQKQREAVYEPFRERLAAVFSREGWSYFLGDFRRRFSSMLAWFRINWFSWRAGLSVAIVGLLVAGIYRLAHATVVKVQAALRRRRQRRDLRRLRRVEIYQRLERVLSRCGLRRRVQQTQHEFAQDVGGRIPASRVAAIPARVAAAFYRVRFGGERLKKRELRELDQEVTQLEQELRTRPPLLREGTP